MPSARRVKGDLLFEEALKDLENKCFNKATGGFYFASRWFAEGLLVKLGGPIPRRDDKLANAIEDVGAAASAECLRTLYSLRLKADYSELSVTPEEAKHVKEIAEKALEELKGLLKKAG